MIVWSTCSPPPLPYRLWYTHVLRYGNSWTCVMVLMRWLKWESLPWHLNRKSIFFKIFSRRLTYIGKLNIKVASTYYSCNPEMKNQINKDYNDKKHASMKYWPKPRQLNWMNQQFFFPIKNICISSHKVYFNSTNSKGTVKRKVLLYI